MSLEQQPLLPFGPFRLDPGRRLLFRRDEAIQLRPRVFDTLLVLARKPGEIAPKEELLEAVWPDTVVEENNLNQNVLALRRILEQHPEDGVRIETVARRGYRLIAPALEEVPSPGAAPAPVAAAGGKRSLPGGAGRRSRRSCHRSDLASAACGPADLGRALDRRPALEDPGGGDAG